MDQHEPPEALHGLGDGTRVLVEPDDGVLPLLELIGGARRSVYIKQFTFTHPALLQAAIAAHRAGRDVRIMLNPHRSSGDRANDAPFAELEAAGIKMQWSSPTFAVTHEKSMVIDERLALIATFNFCEKYLTLTRDYGLVTDQPEEVAQIRDCFLADWERQRFHPTPASALLWSNQNSRRIMSAFIDGARHTLDIQHPKFVDATILERIVQARRRDVHVRLLCGGRHGISEWDVLDTFASLRVLQPPRRQGAQAEEPSPACQAVDRGRQERTDRLDEHRSQRIRSASRARRGGDGQGGPAPAVPGVRGRLARGTPLRRAGSPAVAYAYRGRLSARPGSAA